MCQRKKKFILPVPPEQVVGCWQSFSAWRHHNIMSHIGCTPPAVSSGIWRRGTQASQERSTHSWLPAAIVLLLPGTAFSSLHEVEGELLCQPDCHWLIPSHHRWVSFVSNLGEYRSRENKMFVMGKQAALLLLNAQWGTAPGIRQKESWGQPDWMDQRRQERKKTLLSFRAKRKVTPRFSTYWGFLDPILCCGLGFQIPLVVNSLNSLHVGLYAESLQILQSWGIHLSDSQK